MPRKQVHLWQADLVIDAAAQARFVGLLDDVERARAEQFRFADDRMHYIAAHGWLRVLLGHYLDREPDRIRFKPLEKDKPVVADDAGLQFNMSHSREVAVYAVSRDTRVGVDVEWIAPTLTLPDLVRYLAPAEQEAVAQLPADEQASALTVLWVRKEAVVKAAGTGLDIALPEIDLWHQDHAQVAEHVWAVHDFGVPPGYCAAVAVDAPGVIVPDTARPVTRLGQ